MHFNQRLERAIQRGQNARDVEGRNAAAAAASEEDLKQLHSTTRIELSERIEECLQQLADHFPGFRFETIVGEKGWGARISRDDISLKSDRHTRNAYSRLEMLVKPFTSTHIVELSAKGTIRNRETLNRSHYQFLSEADKDSFAELIDLWVLEYAEQFASDQ